MDSKVIAILLNRRAISFIPLNLLLESGSCRLALTFMLDSKLNKDLKSDVEICVNYTHSTEFGKCDPVETKLIGCKGAAQEETESQVRIRLFEIEVIKHANRSASEKHQPQSSFNWVDCFGILTAPSRIKKLSRMKVLESFLVFSLN